MIRQTQFGIMCDTIKEYEQEVKALDDWIKAALADGWTSKPTYSNESIDRAMTLNKEGFHVSTIRRPPEKSRGNIDLTGWGPDGLVVRVPRVYDWESMKAALRICNYCKAIDVDTQRVGFAGRCCANCIEQKRKEIETRGWNA